MLWRFAGFLVIDNSLECLDGNDGIHIYLNFQ